MAYAITTWEDETGDAEISEFDHADGLIRRCVWTLWPESEQTGSMIGEAVWFDPGGKELERRPLRKQPSG